ncbi:MAG: hypothetical protein APF76_04540 [Desulfitibacter sp. BRH_c19]|nr:MAG: hypothetical protein APF76_04540 [Desulfitibacter sp. BRH_c19]
MKKLRIYRIEDDYIEFLRRYDNINVKYNKNSKRPYVGVVLVVNGIKYFAPLASPRPKHNKMKNSLDFIKIDKGKYGVINLNNMLPIVESALIEYNIMKEQDIAYRNLLLNQLSFINKNADIIMKKAARLYEKVTSGETHLNKRCVKFKLLEEKCLEYTPGISVVRKEAAATLEEDYER